MNRNDYRRALVMLRSLKTGVSGYVRLERRTLMGTLQFTVNGVQPGGELYAILLWRSGGAWHAVRLDAFGAPRYGQTGLVWKFDPRNIENRTLEQYDLAAVIEIRGGICELMLCGNLNGSVEADWTQVREAACRLFSPVRISGAPIPSIAEKQQGSQMPSAEDHPQTLPDYSEESPAYPGDDLPDGEPEQDSPENSAELLVNPPDDPSGESCTISEDTDERSRSASDSSKSPSVSESDSPIPETVSSVQQEDTSPRSEEQDACTDPPNTLSAEDAALQRDPAGTIAAPEGSSPQSSPSDPEYGEPFDCPCQSDDAPAPSVSRHAADSSMQSRYALTGRTEPDASGEAEAPDASAYEACMESDELDTPAREPEIEPDEFDMPASDTSARDPFAAAARAALSLTTYPSVQPDDLDTPAQEPEVEPDEFDTPAQESEVEPDELDTPAADQPAAPQTAGEQLDLADPNAVWPDSIEPLRRLFFSSVAVVPFEASGYVFIRAPLPEETGIDSCLAGIYCEDGVPARVCYAIPSAYTPEPPAGLEGYAWRGDGTRGYWVACEELP